MPMPKPKPQEKEKDFISRCMGMDMMNEDYPDEKQRVAVCYSLWRKDKENKNMKQNIERRIYPAEAIEIRKGESDSKSLIGYAAVFNSLSEDLGGFREKIAIGAFTKSLNKKADVRALWNHDPNYVLGRTKNKSLVLKEDERGLQIKIIPPNTQFAKDLMELIERGDVDQMSYSFRTITDEWTQDKTKNENIRTLKEVDLFDVSPVTFPAYPDTQIALRSMEQWQDTLNATIERDLARAEETQRRLLLQKKRGRELRMKRNLIILQKH